jgi:hypothetical protein
MPGEIFEFRNFIPTAEQGPIFKVDWREATIGDGGIHQHDSASTPFFNRIRRL